MIERLFRGGHARRAREASEKRSKGNSHLAREASAKVIQASWRAHLAAADEARRRQLEEMSALRAGGGGGWGRVRRQFVAAQLGKNFNDAGREANAVMTRAAW